MKEREKDNGNSEFGKNKNSEIALEKVTLKTMISLQVIYFLGNSIGYVFGNLQYFYTDIVLLPIQLFMISFFIYTIWNMFNDPILGYFCDRSTRFTSKWGKRFIFILIGAFGYCIINMLAFSAPIDALIAPIFAFIWLLIILTFEDGFFSLMDLNWTALVVNKIREDKKRKNTGLIGVLMGTFGILLGVIIPPIIIGTFGDNKTGWLFQGLIMGSIAIVAVFIMIPSIRESKELREKRIKIDAAQVKEGFFTIMKTALKLKPLIAYTIVYLGFQITIVVLQASIGFWFVHVLGLGFQDSLIPMALFVLAAPISAFIWNYLAKKYGSKKIFFFCCISLALAILPNLWINTYELTLLVFFIVGFCVGGQWSLLFPFSADIIDEATVRTGKRQEGQYEGIIVFFQRLTYAFQVIIIGSIQLFTGYNPGADIQPPLAILGIHIQMSIVPIIILVLTALIFWKWYDITPERVKHNKEKLIELGL